MAEVLKEKDDEQLEIVEGEASGSTLDIPEDKKAVAAQQEKQASDDDDDDDDDRHASNEDGETDDEREAIRLRRREEKKERRRRREEAMRRDKLELEFLQKRNDELERRQSSVEQRMAQTDIAAIDQRMAQVKQRIETAERVMAKAISANNGDDAAKALKIRDEAQQALFQLAQYRNAQVAQIQQPEAQRQVQPQKQQPDMPPPKQIELAQGFIKRHSWYDPNGRDEASRIVLALDQALSDEGMDPSSEEYWTELESRIKRRVPEKFEQPAAQQGAQQNAQQRKPAGGPQIGSGRSSSGGTKQVYISAERKQALIDAGVWDDPVLRDKYIKRYMEYDRQAQS